MGMSNETGAALPPFLETINIDVSKYIQKRPTWQKGQNGDWQQAPESEWWDYLPWQKCLYLLYKKCGAKYVRYGATPNPDGYPAFFINGQHPFVKVWVDIDGTTFEATQPVMNGNICPQNPTQMDIHNSIQRGFVKAVAVNTGLGFSLWFNEEEKMQSEPAKTEPLEDIVKREIEGIGTKAELKQYYNNNPTLHGKDNIIELITQRAEKLAA